MALPLGSHELLIAAATGNASLCAVQLNDGSTGSVRTLPVPHDPTASAGTPLDQRLSVLHVADFAAFTGASVSLLNLDGECALSYVLSRPVAINSSYAAAWRHVEGWQLLQQFGTVDHWQPLGLAATAPQATTASGTSQGTAAASEG